MRNQALLLTATAAAVLLTACSNADLRTARRADAAGDHATANAIYQELASYGIPEAQVEMAMQTLQTKSSPADKAKANAMLEEAARGNAALSMKLGDLYEKGEKAPRDLKLAYKYYKQAFDLGATKAGYKIGNVLLDNDTNYGEARGWFEQALAAGETKAALRLGRLYEKPGYSGRNPTKALGYYLHAQSLGLNVGSSITKLKPKMSAAQIQSAEIFASQLASGVTPTGN